MSSPVVSPKSPPLAWLHGFLEPSLVEAPGYKIDSPQVTIKLDQNESPWDVPKPLKEKVLAKLMAKPWNRYPSPFADDLAAILAKNLGVSSDAVLFGPGSNYLISLILSTFGRGIVKGRGGKVVLARPSFPLYESHCRYDGIPYEAWELNDELEYDVAKLPALPPGSLVVFASPNNPVGNVLPRRIFKELLTKHPETLFVADEAYVEYASEPYTELLAEHANLLLLRTFSKTMGCAGVRVGYVLGHPSYLGFLRKLRVPYLLNYFAIACSEVMLEDAEVRQHLKAIQRNAVEQRGAIYKELSAIGANAGFRVKPSEANFLLLRWPDNAGSTRAYQHLVAKSILVRNISGNPGLAGCLRITLGDEAENQALVAAFASL